jgi:hypothetical protein
MSISKLGSFKVDLNYNQLLVYDVSVEVPECSWTEAHCDQGFARRESTVCFDTILQYGDAEVTIYEGPYSDNALYQRAVAVPFFSPTGRVIVQSVLEIYVAKVVFLPKGYYRLYAAQWLADDGDEDRQSIDLFFEALPAPAAQSAVLRADEGLNPPAVLLEDAGEP